MADGYLSRRQFVAGGAAVALAGMFGVMTGCTAGGSGAAAGGADSQSGNGGGAGGGSSEPITFVWLPDNSSSDMTSSREAIGAAILAACGRQTELLTTTDYNVAIEAIASGKAQMALLGPEGYVQANKKNSAVQAAFTNSDEDGGLDGACYYSRICVRTEDADAYKSGSGYSIEGIKGGSFVRVRLRPRRASRALERHRGGVRPGQSDVLLEAAALQRGAVRQPARGRW